MSEKSYVGKYVCYGEKDGSFSWGRIKDEGVVNTPNGEREVFILTDRMTCRVARSAFERGTISAISRRINEGTAGPMKKLGRQDPAKLPDYQRFGDCKKLPAPSEDCDQKLADNPSNLPVKSTPEGAGLVPRLENTMNIQQSKGLDILQQAGTFHSQFSGNEESALLRKYGYDTNVRKDAIDLDKDIIERGEIGFEDLTDDELFLLAMQAKMETTVSEVNQGIRNILMLQAGGGVEEVAKEAAKTLKERRKIL